MENDSKMLPTDPGNGLCQQKVLAEYNNNNTTKMLLLDTFSSSLLGCIRPICLLAGLAQLGPMIQSEVIHKIDDAADLEYLEALG